MRVGKSILRVRLWDHFEPDSCQWSSLMQSSKKEGSWSQRKPNKTVPETRNWHIGEVLIGEEWCYTPHSKASPTKTMKGRIFDCASKEEQKKFATETNRQMENNRAIHTPTHTNHKKHTNTCSRINMETQPKGKKFLVYLPYSLCVLQWAGGAWPWLKNDTHGLALLSTSKHKTYAQSTCT